MRVFDDAPLTEFLHHSVTFLGDGAILNIELLKSSAIISHTLNAPVTDHFTALDTELL